MHNAGDVFNRTVTGGLKFAVVYARRVVAVQNDQGAGREGLDVIAQVPIQHPQAVEVVLLPNPAARENLLFLFGWTGSAFERRGAATPRPAPPNNSAGPDGHGIPR